MSINLDFNSRTIARASLSERMSARIDNYCEAREEEPRTYLGASQIGDECLRRVQYQVTAAPAKPLEGRTRRIFARGHLYEDRAYNWLTAAGFVISRANALGDQHGFSVLGGEFRGHVDGIVMEVPPEFEDEIETRCLWECKALGAKGFAAVKKNGLAKAYPGYADQAVIYQTYMELEHPVLFTVVCPDTEEMHHELVPYDAKRAQEVSDRAAHVVAHIRSGDLLPRVSGDPGGFPCAWCQFQPHCWERP